MLRAPRPKEFAAAKRAGARHASALAARVFRDGGLRRRLPEPSQARGDVALEPRGDLRAQTLAPGRFGVEDRVEPRLVFGERGVRPRLFYGGLRLRMRLGVVFLLRLRKQERAQLPLERVLQHLKLVGEVERREDCDLRNVVDGELRGDQAHALVNELRDAAHVLAVAARRAEVVGLVEDVHSDRIGVCAQVLFAPSKSSAWCVVRRASIIKHAALKLSPAHWPSNFSHEALAGQLSYEVAHLQREQHARKLRHRQAARLRERVDVRGLVVREQLQQRALAVRDVRRKRRVRVRLARALLLHFGRQKCRGYLRRELRDYVLPLLHELRARALDEKVRAERIARRDVPRNRVDLAVLLHREPRRNQRAGVLRGLHDYYSETQAADYTVAVRKIFGDGRSPQRELRDECPAPLKYLRGELAVVARIDFVNACAEYGHRSTPGFERAAVRGGVYAARESRDDSHAARSQLARQHLRDVLPVGRAAPRADHADRRRFQTFLPAPAHVERYRRVWNLSKELRVRAVVKYEHVRVLDFAHALKLSGGLFVSVAQSD